MLCIGSLCMLIWSTIDTLLGLGLRLELELEFPYVQTRNVCTYPHYLHATSNL